jgi:hypothetical protein
MDPVDDIFKNLFDIHRNKLKEENFLQPPATALRVLFLAIAATFVSTRSVPAPNEGACSAPER